MKIGILTLPLHTNYGGILQAYALQTILERLGHDVKVINTPPIKKTSFPKAIIHYIYSNFQRRVLKNKRYSTNWFSGCVATYYIQQHVRIFIETNIHNRFVKSLNELQNDEFDAIIVGSDQVWRKGYSAWSDIEDYYLKFAESWSIKRISYAASFGKDTIEDYSIEERRNIINLLHLFNGISVRELSGIDICRTNFNIQAIQVIDPTLLLDKEDYLSLAYKTVRFQFAGNLLTYVLDNDNEVSATINYLKDSNNWEPFMVYGKVNDNNAKLTDRIQPPVEYWLQAFNSSEAVITDSFHACVFAILFNKPFLVFGNKSRGMSRFETLLKQTHQIERLVKSHSEAVLKSSLLSIKPNALSYIKENRNIAFDFLKSALQ